MNVNTAAAPVHAIVTYMAADDTVTAMRVSLTNGRIRNPQATDAEIARKIIAIRRGLSVSTITVVDVNVLGA